jgi:hypothetical protein
MGAKNDHQQKWLHNRNFLESILDQESYPDWVLVAAFYTAVHAVETLFATANCHSTDHHERKRILRQEGKWKEVFTHYHPLENIAWAARYECGGLVADLASAKTNFVQGHLHKLEQAVCKQIGKSAPTLKLLFTPRTPNPPKS